MQLTKIEKRARALDQRAKGMREKAELAAGRMQKVGTVLGASALAGFVDKKVSPDGTVLRLGAAPVMAIFGGIATGLGVLGAGKKKSNHLLLNAGLGFLSPYAYQAGGLVADRVGG